MEREPRDNRLRYHEEHLVYNHALHCIVSRIATDAKMHLADAKMYFSITQWQTVTPNYQPAHMTQIPEDPGVIGSYSDVLDRNSWVTIPPTS